MRLHRRHETDTPRGAVTTGVPLSNAGGQRGLAWAGGLPQRGAVLAFVRRRRVGAALPRRRHRPRRVRRARPGGADRRRRRAAGAGSGAVGPCRGRRDDATVSARPVGGLTRRRIFGVGIAGLAAAAAGGLELVAHGVLPGRSSLDQLDGACSVPAPPLIFSAPGPSVSGTFYSRARRRDVGYTIAYPPGTRPGSRLPLIIGLHAYGGDHDSALGSLGLARGLALHVGGRPLPPRAIAAADGGGGDWNPHPDDDPMGVVIREAIPRGPRKGLRRGRPRNGTLGISLGGHPG